MSSFLSLSFSSFPLVLFIHSFRFSFLIFTFFLFSSPFFSSLSFSLFLLFSFFAPLSLFSSFPALSFLLSLSLLLFASFYLCPNSLEFLVLLFPCHVFSCILFFLRFSNPLLLSTQSSLSVSSRLILWNNLPGSVKQAVQKRDFIS